MSRNALTHLGHFIVSVNVDLCGVRANATILTSVSQFSIPAIRMQHVLATTVLFPVTVKVVIREMGFIVHGIDLLEVLAMKVKGLTNLIWLWSWERPHPG